MTVTMQDHFELELFPPASRTTTANGTGVDLQPYATRRNLKAIVHVGAVTGTTPTLVVKLQESDVVGSGYVDITGATTPTLNAAGITEIHAVATKQFVRAVATIGGSTPNFTFGSLLVVPERSS